MFQGSSALSLDAKGRLQIPVKAREGLLASCAGQLTLTRHPDGCVLMFTRPDWESNHRPRIARWQQDARAWQRIFLGSAQDVDMDASGRILVPPELRDAVGLTKEVMLMGMAGHFEIWDAATLQAKEREAVAAGVPDSIANFSF